MFYGSDNFSVGVGLSIASPSHHSNRYMSDQTFHTPNFGDEEFDLPPILPHQSNDHSHMQGNMTYSSMGMHGVPDQQGQQQHYTSMYLPEHMTTPMTIHSPVTYGGSPPTYTTLSSPHAPSQSPVGGNPHMMHHPQTGARPQQQMQPMIPPGSAPPGRSPTNSGSPANAETGSEDSDDSVPVSQMQPGVVIKRPSPEPAIITQVANVAVAPVKKPKPQKKKKKRDPNEPQKPVSAYALFFRDTQAAIKGQNPNASFGEVSKIVASMWDALDVEHKNVYKKKTEAAKKEYLKALAAYRASLVSKGAPTDSADGSGMYPPNFNANMSSTPHYQSHTQQPQGQSYYAGGQTGQGAGKKSQQQTQQSPQQNQAPPPQQATGPPQSAQGMPPPQTQAQPQHSPVQQPPQQQSPHQQNHQQMMQQMPGSHHIESNQYGGMRPNPGYMNTMGDGSHSHGMGMPGGMHHMGGHGQMVPSGPVMSHMNSDGHDHSQRQMCVRNGCNNMAITSPEWENEYCSSDCVVTHCRDVFTNWVSTNQTGNPNYGNGVK